MCVHTTDQVVSLQPKCVNAWDFQHFLMTNETRGEWIDGCLFCHHKILNKNYVGCLLQHTNYVPQTQMFKIVSKFVNKYQDSRTQKGKIHVPKNCVLSNCTTLCVQDAAIICLHNQMGLFTQG